MKEVSNYGYGIGVKSQGQKYLKSLLQPVTKTPLSMLYWKVFIFNITIAVGTMYVNVDGNECFRPSIWHRRQRWRSIIFRIGLWIVLKTPLSIACGNVDYSKVFRSPIRPWIQRLTSKVRKICLRLASNANSSFISSGLGVSYLAQWLLIVCSWRRRCQNIWLWTQRSW